MQGVKRSQTISSETSAPLHAPHSRGPGPSDEEKGSEEEHIDDLDLVSFGEFVFATDNDTLISLSSQRTICSFKLAASSVV